MLVPAGRFLTGSFSLASYIKLKVAQDGVLAGSQDPADYPLIAVLPSYGARAVVQTSCAEYVLVQALGAISRPTR